MKWNNLHSFYTSKEWLEFKQRLILERVNEQGVLLCEHCRKPLYKSYEIIGHHKKELTTQNMNDYDISLNENNVELICHSCHNKHHNRFGTYTQKVYLVWGSPLAGKSTFVKNSANPDDLIVDIDSIWECISSNERYNKPDRLRTNVFNIRDCLLDMVRTRCGKWRNAWIIMSSPLLMERERFKDLYSAEDIFIDTSRDECLSRSLGRPKEWTQYVLDWFDKYQPHNLYVD